MIDLLLISVAVWRVAHMVTAEEGPGRIFHRFRTWAGVQVDVHPNGVEEVIESDPGTLAEWASCLWCFSVSLGVAATVLYAISPPAAVAVATPFFLSGMAIFMDNKLND